MPTYEYRCANCAHEFELFQQMSDPVKRKCPKCGKPRLERLIGTGAGVIFKGGGFYQTDYRSDSYKKAAEAEKKSTSTSETPAAASNSPGNAANTTKDAAGSTKPASTEAAVESSPKKPKSPPKKRSR